MNLADKDFNDIIGLLKPRSLVVPMVAKYIRYSSIEKRYIKSIHVFFVYMEIK